MEKIAGRLQNYAWGSSTLMQGLLGQQPTEERWAEMWFGDHPRLPSTVVRTGEPLQAGLPFLLKLLAADAPLSIQAHPSLAQARAGFAREDREGVAIDAPERTYRDDNHKPELICALTPFDALCGFRPPDDVRRDLAAVTSLSPAWELLDGVDGGADGLRAVVGWLLGLSPTEVERIVAEVAPRFELTASLAERYPGDPGSLVALLLNRVRLEPGQALFLEAGNLHAYLSGLGVELMANSDNVVRGGLTPKHIDTDELMAVVDFTPLEVNVQTADGPQHRFETPVADFGLIRLEVNGPLAVEPSGPELMLASHGHVTVSAGAENEVLAPGEAAFVSDADGAVEIDGSGLLWRATVGHH